MQKTGPKSYSWIQQGGLDLDSLNMLKTKKKGSPHLSRACPMERHPNLKPRILHDEIDGK